MKVWICAFVAGAILTTGCSRNRPPNLTPDASLAFDNGRIVEALDTTRDVAIIANSFNQQPFTTPIVRRVVTVHRSALVLIETRGTGWQAQVNASLSELLKNTTGEVTARLTPYVELTRTLINRLATREFDEQLSAEVLASYRELLVRSAAVDESWLTAHP